MYKYIAIPLHYPLKSNYWL